MIARCHLPLEKFFRFYEKPIQKEEAVAEIAIFWLWWPNLVFFSPLRKHDFLNRSLKIEIRLFPGKRHRVLCFFSLWLLVLLRILRIRSKLFISTHPCISCFEYPSDSSTKNNFGKSFKFVLKRSLRVLRDYKLPFSQNDVV